MKFFIFLFLFLQISINAYGIELKTSWSYTKQEEETITGFKIYDQYNKLIIIVPREKRSVTFTYDVDDVKSFYITAYVDKLGNTAYDESDNSNIITVLPAGVIYQKTFDINITRIKGFHSDSKNIK